MKLIKRDYLTKLIDVINTPDIKVITGVRRSGKSKLLEMFKEYIVKNISNNNIIHINFSFPENEYLKEYHELYNYIESKYIKGKQNFVLIDEVQMCAGFEIEVFPFSYKEFLEYYELDNNSDSFDKYV